MCQVLPEEVPVRWTSKGKSLCSQWSCDKTAQGVGGRTHGKGDPGEVGSSVLGGAVHGDIEAAQGGGEPVDSSQHLQAASNREMKTPDGQGPGQQTWPGRGEECLLRKDGIDPLPGQGDALPGRNQL